MPYVTWEYYCSLFSQVPEEEFDRLCRQASAKLDVYTHMRARNFYASYDGDKATDWQKQVCVQIKNDVCELISAIYIQESSGIGNGVSSVSNDGYSESYAIATASDREAQLKAIIINGLCGTGLVGVL